MSGGDEFDYIVVGSGAGGGPIAANLARAGFSVALFEAGGAAATCDYDVPAFFPKVSEDPELRWDYFVKHYEDVAQQDRDPKCVSNNGEPGIWYPRSGTLGGCTAHNALITICPNASDWDYIAEETGDASWSAKKMEKYFTRIERCSYWSLPNFGRPHPGGHGFTGWLSTDIARPKLLVLDWKIFRIVLITILYSIKNDIWSTIRTVWTAWCNFQGGPAVFVRSFFDPNDFRTPCCEREGVFYVPFATESGRRVSVRNLLSVTQQDFPENLNIYTNALVTRVLFDKGSSSSNKPRAIGVEYLQGLHLYRADPGSRAGGSSTERRLRARREVILSAGAFNTPQLLMLSGIGPRSELDKHSIETLVELPGVGQNLQDRYELSVVSKTRTPFALTRGSTFRRPNIGELPDPQFEQWLKGRGPYSTNGVLISFTKKSRRELAEPDLFIFCVPGVFKGYFPGYSGDLAKNTSEFSWLILKSHTNNRAGMVTLRSRDPCDSPNVSFRYFDEGSEGFETDLHAVVEGINVVRTLNDRLRGIIEKELFPGPAFDTIGLLKQLVRDQAWGHHASCTARMGRADDPLAVVDSKFRVIGTEGLRIVDASVFVRIPGFFIVTAIYMIAEKATDVILSDQT